MKLIDKDIVIAEIKRRLKGLKACHADRVAGYAGEISGLERLFSFLDTLEVKNVIEPIKWSKEDEKMLQCLIRDQEKALNDVRNDKYGHSEIISDLKEMYRERIKWLESLNERLKGE